jgi:hypothetical protein
VFIFDRKEDKIRYDDIKPRLKGFHYADIHGEPDFLKIFLKELVDGEGSHVLPSVNFEKIYNYAVFMRDAYALPELENYFEWTIEDCLLGMERYEEYLSKTKPTRIDIFTRACNLRLNIQEHIHFPAEPIDIMLTFGVRKKSSVIEIDFNTYEKALYKVFDNYLGEQKSWFDTFKKFGGYNPIYDFYLLQHMRILSVPCLPFKISYFSTARGLKDDIRNLANMAERIARRELDVPVHDDKWASETILFLKIRSLFPDIPVIRQGFPSWLIPQRFDIWVPSRSIAVEYNGKQHYEPIGFFGGLEGFRNQKKRDRRKAALCKKNGVRLFIVRYDEDMDAAVSKIRSSI